MKKSFENFFLQEELYPLPVDGEKKRYLLEKDHESELILMVWAKGSMTPIHDHAGSGCWTRLLKGDLKEKTYERGSLRLISEESFNHDGITYVDKDEGLHQLMNESGSFAFSLHLYVQPLSHCNVYDESTGLWSIMGNHYDFYEGSENELSRFY